jgi:hypothetical protein
MPMQLLERLCEAQLPMAINDDEDIAKCDVLRTAKLIEAHVPPVLYELKRAMYSAPATVLRVTASGESATGKRTRRSSSWPDHIPRERSSSALESVR